MPNDSFYADSFAPSTTVGNVSHYVDSFAETPPNVSFYTDAFITSVPSTEPFLISVFPNPLSYGQTLVITGTNLNRVGAVIVDGVGREFTYVNPTTITVNLPMMATGPKQVYVNYI